MRLIPEIKIEGQEGYAKLLGHNFDSVQEVFDLSMCRATEILLEKGQKAAQALSDDQGVTIQLGPEEFQIWVGGAAGGDKWVVENDDFMVFFKTPFTADGQVRRWGVKVRYKSAGLWEYGYKFLKQRVVEFFLFQSGFAVIDQDGCVLENLPVENNKSWQRITRVDYAFDMHSEKFSREMQNQRVAENLILPSGVKYQVVGTSSSIETMTACMNRKSCQIQVYDKGREITEASGKTWMFKVWERNGYKVPEDGKAKNVWRLEIRFGKDFIQDRGILCMDEFLEKLQELCCEAIFKRRLAVPAGTHRERWDLHPLWAEAYRATDQVGQYAPIGRQRTLRAEELKTMLGKQVIGLGRSMSVLEGGAYDDAAARENLKRLGEGIEKDKKHRTKEEKAQERYKYTREAR